MNLISHPFRLAPDGSVATVEDGSEEAAAEAIAVMVLTRKGERDLVPDFGVTDPTFDGLSLAELQAGLADYGPQVDVGSVETTYPSETTERVVLHFELQEP